MQVKIPFVGQAYLARSLNLSAQRCVNLFPELGGPDAKEPIALFGTPGLKRKVTAPNGAVPIRALEPFKGDLWAVAGNLVLRIAANWAVNVIGTIATSEGPVSVAQNETQIALVDGVSGYYYDVPSLTWGQITDPEFPFGCRRISYLKNRFLVEAPQSQSMSWSAIGDVRAWDGLDFTSADGAPDNIVAHIADHQEIYVFGETTTQILVADTEGFSNSPNTFMQQGCAAPFSPANIDNSIMWLGRDEMGEGVVWQVRGGASPVRVSNHGIEYAISQYERIDDAIAYAYQMEGHLFYVLTFPTAERTWVFDVASQMWHERAYMQPATGELTRHRSNCHAMFNGRHVVGDFENGRIYEMSMDHPTDDGDAILRLRASQTASNNQRRLNYQSVQIDLETGVGGDGQNPQVMLRYSDDGGHTWSNRRTASMGRIGQYGYRARFPRMGSGRNRVFEMSVSDPVKVVVLGAYADVVAGP